MNLLILIAFGLGTTIPCVGLWVADTRERLARTTDHGALTVRERAAHGRRRDSAPCRSSVFATSA
jgi:hypothetical protein